MEKRILLARSKRHPPRFHTVPAGFAEAGESMEQDVARDVYEETASQVYQKSIQYVAAQPWLFPHSTMIGFAATMNDQDEK